MTVRRTARALILSAALAGLPLPVAAADAGRTPDAGVPSDLGNTSSRTDTGIDRRTPTARPDTGTAGAAPPDGRTPGHASKRPDPSGTSSGSNNTKAAADDLSPQTRLKRAERAFRNGNFRDIPQLLEPALEPKPQFDGRPARVRARELLGVGLYFRAQQSKKESTRAELLDRARRQFLKLLRDKPSHELDPLIYPASVVDVFESVKENHSEELAKLRARNQSPSNPGRARSGGARTLYIERQVQRNYFIWNFAPGGMGQFQNGEPIKGWLFASGQAALVGVHLAGFLRIQALRNPNGKIPRELLQNAQNWRRAQIVAWSLFGGLYAYSVVDGIMNFKPREVEIRTLDEPPPELSDGGSSTGNAPTVGIGLGTIRIRW